MKSPLRLAIAVAAAALVLGAGGVYAYYFSGLRSTPAPLALSSASPTAAPTAAPPAGLAGDWKIGTGSEAGFRVGEVFAGQTARHDAVVRTATVSGSLKAASGAGGYAVSGLTVTVSTTDLRSQDTVAGFNVAQRDRIISNQLATSRFPTATFTSDSLTVPATVDAGLVPLTVPGKLTLHGVTRDVTASVQAQRTPSGIEVAGTIPIVMTDYGVDPPRLPITSVESNVTVEFKLELARG